MSQAEPLPNKLAQAQLSWLEPTFEPNKEGGLGRVGEGGEEVWGWVGWRGEV
jgi:hypothetical protein